MPEAFSPIHEDGLPVPLLIYVLAAGVFLMGTTEFIVAGLLPEIAADIGVRVADAGLMITVFAIGHVIVALTDSFPLILGRRYVTALATGAFSAVAAVVAAKAVGPG